MRRLILLAALAAYAVSLAGCGQTTKNVWKDTRKYYREYLNTPATLAFESAGAEPAEERLAKVFLPVGLALESFRRDLQGQDSFPQEGWAEGMLSKYPWLDGIAVISPEMTTYLQVPGFTMKPLDFAPLFVEDAARAARELRGTAQDTPLGPEVLVGNPFFANNEFKGLVIAYFDPRKLVSSLCPDPARLVMLDGSMLLWSGHYVIDATPLQGVDWDAALVSDSSGTAKNSIGEFLWVVKYLGAMPLVFAATVDEFPIQSAAESDELSSVPASVTVKTSPASEHPEGAALPLSQEQ